MNINSENKTKDQLDLNIHVPAEEIKTLFNNELKKSVQKVKMKGFRPGKTPPALLKRMYGTEMLAEAINKLVLQESENYMKENGIETYGRLVFRKSETPFSFDPDTNEPFEATLSFVRAVDVEAILEGLQGNVRYELPQIATVDLEAQVQNILLQQGMDEDKDIVEKEDVRVVVDARPVDDAAREPIEIRLDLRTIKNTELKDLLMGKKVGDAFEFRGEQASDNDEFIKYNIVDKLNHRDSDATEEEDTTPETKVTYDHTTPLSATITKIVERKPAEMDETFFAAIDPNGGIKDKEELEKVLTESMEREYRPSANVLFFLGLRDLLSAQYPLDVSEGFVKEYFIQNTELNQHALDHHMHEIEADFSWSRIKDSIDKELGLQVNEGELRRLIAAEINAYFGSNSVPQNIMNNLIDSQMKNSKYVEEKAQTIYLAKLAQALLENYNIETVRIPMDEFIDKIREVNEKSAENETHSHDHSHDDDTDYEEVLEINSTESE